jgi:CBS domain containing-hemolysin-like protein
LVVGRLGLPAPLAAAMLIPLTLTFGEMVPKALFQHHANRIAPLVAFPIYGLSVVLRPALWILGLITRILGGSQHHNPAVSRRELQLLLDVARSEDLSASERQLLRRVMAFTENTVADAMVALIEVVGVEENTPTSDVAKKMAESGFSRLPVYRERVDQIVGVVLHQDVIATEDWTVPVSQIQRSPMYVPETKQIDNLLVEMRRSKQRMAVVIDEYGGAVGLITTEDILEEIVGDIEDESDRSKSQVRRTGEREWLASGRAERHHLEAACGLILPDGDFETVAGYILFALGKVPGQGEIITLGRFSLVIQKANERVIQEVRIRRDRG